jgi:uncharacterized protein
MASRRTRGAGALLLAPGAGSNRDNPCLVAIERAVAPLPTERMDFPYRKAGRRAPDRAPALIDAVRQEAAGLVQRAHVKPTRLVLGGRSMGGRMCSMAVAQGLPAAGLVLISYPLHPPGRPDNLRVEHLPAIKVPCLFVSGTRDPFGTVDEMEHWSAKVAGSRDLVWIDRAAHDLKGADHRVATIVADWISAL